MRQEERPECFRYEKQIANSLYEIEFKEVRLDPIKHKNPDNTVYYMCGEVYLEMEKEDNIQTYWAFNENGQKYEFPCAYIDFKLIENELNVYTARVTESFILKQSNDQIDTQTLEDDLKEIFEKWRDNDEKLKISSIGKNKEIVFALTYDFRKRTQNLKLKVTFEYLAQTEEQKFELTQKKYEKRISKIQQLVEEAVNAGKVITIPKNLDRYKVKKDEATNEVVLKPTQRLLADTDQSFGIEFEDLKMQILIQLTEIPVKFTQINDIGDQKQYMLNGKEYYLVEGVYKHYTEQGVEEKLNDREKGIKFTVVDHEYDEYHGSLLNSQISEATTNILTAEDVFSELRLIMADFGTSDSQIQVLLSSASSSLSFSLPYNRARNTIVEYIQNIPLEKKIVTLDERYTQLDKKWTRKIDDLLQQISNVEVVVRQPVIQNLQGQKQSNHDQGAVSNEQVQQLSNQLEQLRQQVTYLQGKLDEQKTNDQIDEQARRLANNEQEITQLKHQISQLQLRNQQIQQFEPEPQAQSPIIFNFSNLTNIQNQLFHSEVLISTSKLRIPHTPPDGYYYCIGICHPSKDQSQDFTQAYSANSVLYWYPQYGNLNIGQNAIPLQQIDLRNQDEIELSYSIPENKLTIIHYGDQNTILYDQEIGLNLGEYHFYVLIQASQ